MYLFRQYGRISQHCLLECQCVVCIFPKIQYHQVKNTVYYCYSNSMRSSTKEQNHQQIYILGMHENSHIIYQLLISFNVSKNDAVAL